MFLVVEHKQALGTALMEQFGGRRKGQISAAGMGLVAHHLANGVAQDLVNLLVPLQGIAQIDHRIKQHHVGASIKSDFPHHEVLLGEFTHQHTVCIHHR